MKKSTLAALLILAVLAAAVGLRLYGNVYPIAPDGSNLETYAVDYLNRGREHPDPGPLKLYDSIDLGDRRWTLMEWGEDLGALRMEKGLNGRYKLAGASYGREDSAYREYLVKLRHVHGRMLTAAGRELAERRHQVMEAFFAELNDECGMEGGEEPKK